MKSFRGKSASGRDNVIKCWTRSRLHQEQVLQQRLQSRKLEKLEETKKVLKEAVTSEPYRVGSAKRYISYNVG